MKKVQIALGILVAGTGVMASAFTTKFSNPSTTGWYSYTGSTTTGVTFGSTFVVTVTVLTATATTGYIKSLAICNADATRICAAFYTTLSSTPHAFVTGKSNQ